MLKVWEEKTVIPTYKIGREDKNPMFYEKRVYQGSSGKVYPIPIIDKIYDEKYLKEYKAVYLENEYLKIMILPELGGRIQRAVDKTNNYDFIYYNPVIKPALVGLAGPWISGGIEFNWPQHHRPTTFYPVEYQMIEEDDKVSVILSEIDKMYGTKQTLMISLYKGISYIEIKGKLFNRTDMPQTFLWWANPAVEVNDYTKSVFPPDVTAVYDHGKRDVSEFPIAKGTYYKVDYSRGVDISRYKNLPVPTSYMAYKSKYDFIGGYDFKKEAGLMHIANHHISPGKKQWTWGNGDFGKVWDQNLSDDGRPYIELMTGIYTDNQPDFSWLAPYEEKEFTQYFMPYKQLGEVKNANQDLLLNVEFNIPVTKIHLYATKELLNLQYELVLKDEVIYKDIIDKISPVKLYYKELPIGNIEKLRIDIYNRNHELLISFTNEKYEREVPNPAEAIKMPHEITNNDELYYAGIHLEQYRHATYLPEDYYLEGLKRDSYDVRLNTAMGNLLLRRGQFHDSISYYDKAIKRLLKHNERPYNAEAILMKALALNYLKKCEEAYNLFYKASWSYEQQASAFYHLSILSLAKANEQNVNKKVLLKEALNFIEKSIRANGNNRNAIFIKAYILYLQNNDYLKYIAENISEDMMNYSLLYLKSPEEALVLLGNNFNNYLELSNDFYLVGDISKAITILEDYLNNISNDNPLILYTLAYYFDLICNKDQAKEYYLQAERALPYLCFPNKLSSMIVLEHICNNYQNSGMANYYLGCLYYDKKRYNDAIICYEKSIIIKPDFPTSHRNLAIACFNKLKDFNRSLIEYEIAINLDPIDARLIYEYDQVKKRLHFNIKDRLDYLETKSSILNERDDLYLEYITLLNQNQKFEKANACLLTHKFHVWEGGEGNISKEYVKVNLELGKIALKQNDIMKAINLFNDCFNYPSNLGEGKLTGTVENHINYYLGLAYSKLGQKEVANSYFGKAAIILDTVSSPMFYNDQPSDVIYYAGLALEALGLECEAQKKFKLLEEYYLNHFDDDCRIDYFAVSLPTYLVFDNDLNYENQTYCLYLHGLYLLAMKKESEAKKIFQQVLERRPEFTSIFNLRSFLD